jgi:small-conductance mechanosensitive channel
MDIPPFLVPVITLAVSFIIANVINLILKILTKKAEKTGTKIDDIILHAIGRPLYILVIVAGIYYAIHQTPYLADLIDKFDEGYKYRHFILAIFGTWIVATLAKRFIREYGYELAARTDGHVDERLVALADMSATYIIWLLGIMMALKAVGFEITPLITNGYRWSCNCTGSPEFAFKRVRGRYYHP